MTVTKPPSEPVVVKVEVILGGAVDIREPASLVIVMNTTDSKVVLQMKLRMSYFVSK